MKAIAYYHSLPISDPNALQDIELPAPVAGPRDLLVEVKAISVNPVDTKVRQNVAPEGGAAKVLGWDVAGVVKAVGTDVSLFKPGDKVYYAGSIARAGGNSELHVVDERIVGHMPKSLGFAQAAALPLTGCPGRRPVQTPASHRNAAFTHPHYQKFIERDCSFSGFYL